MEGEEGEEDFFEDDDKNSQTGFSEYLVKGATITSALPQKKKKGNPKQGTVAVGGAGFLAEDGIMKKDSGVAGLDTLS